MSFSATDLQALHRLVATRAGAAPPDAPDRTRWNSLLGTVERELRATKARRENTEETVEAPGASGGLAPTDIGELVFAIDIPLQIDVPRKSPRILWTVGAEKPQAVRGALATKLLGKDKKKHRTALKSWKALPAGATVPFAGGNISADWTPVALNLAPTMNAYRSMQTFSKQNARKEVAKRIADERKRWPSSAWGGRHEKVKHGNKERLSPVGGERRLVRVTRFSARRPDDLGVDVIGGKLPLDQVVIAGILGDDSDAWCAREGHWAPAKTGEGFLRIEVYRLLGEQGVPRPAAARKRSAKAATDST